MRFETTCSYLDRESKAEYVYRKYGEILKGNILDVGADQCFLKRHLSEEAVYTGIGFGEGVDRVVDLEKEGVPFGAREFDLVLCLDVLEHLDKIHEAFDELCRVSKRYLILSLPNAWSDFYGMLLSGPYDAGRPMKFYNLTPEPPADRHKWFFSADEAVKFMGFRGRKNGFKPIQTDFEYLREKPEAFAIQRFSPKLNLLNLVIQTVWCVLERVEAVSPSEGRTQ